MIVCAATGEDVEESLHHAKSTFWVFRCILMQIPHKRQPLVIRTTGANRGFGTRKSVYSPKKMRQLLMTSRPKAAEMFCSLWTFGGERLKPSCSAALNRQHHGGRWPETFSGFWAWNRPSRSPSFSLGCPEFLWRNMVRNQTERVWMQKWTQNRVEPVPQTSSNGFPAGKCSRSKLIWNPSRSENGDTFPFGFPQAGFSAPGSHVTDIWTVRWELWVECHPPRLLSLPVIDKKAAGRRGGVFPGIAVPSFDCRGSGLGSSWSPRCCSDAPVNPAAMRSDLRACFLCSVREWD